MTDQNKPHPEGHSPKQDMSKMNEAQLARQLRDANLSKEEYESLMEDLKKRRRRLDGSGDSVMDDLYNDEP